MKLTILTWSLYYRILFSFILLLTITPGFAEFQKKEIKVSRVTTPPVIDANLNDEVWNSSYVANDFIQVQPYNGKSSTQKTEVRIVYDDVAVYFGLRMYDNAPDSIFANLSKRDEDPLADFIGFFIDPYNDGINSFAFFVTAAGTQFDARVSGPDDDDMDVTWNAVWESDFKIDELGWVVEMKIPFSALRFPVESTDSWGINFYRMVQRNREESSWSFMDNKLQGTNNQLGLMSGISGVEPPMRLSITPYAAGYINKYSLNDKPGYSLKGGVDLKYGISESYTLDMMLIPDFGQVQSDDEILNLTPFETQYDEKRSFFTEGGDLFSRAEIFYSRRIGTDPIFADEAENSLGINEKVETIPSETQIINATKISGKSKNGMSLGFLNAMTAPTYATINDTIDGSERHVLTQPFTNYNVSVLEKSLKNNSFVSLINTNMLMNTRDFGSDVIGSEVKFANKNNSYGIFGKGAISYNWDKGTSKTGGYYDIDLAKTKGKFQMTATQKYFSANYDPNLLGYNNFNNFLVNRVELNYNITDPFWRVLWWRNEIRTELMHYADPLSFSQLELFCSSVVTFRNHLTLGTHFVAGPNSYDFFEARTEGRSVRRAGYWFTGFMFSTDYSKKYVLDIMPGYARAKDDDFSLFELEIAPRFRPNDHILFRLESNLSYIENDRGYASKSDISDSIFFSRRNVNTLENTLNFSYTFTNKAGLSFRLRHYLSKIDNQEFYLLGDNSELINTSSFSMDDRSYSAFNIDMVYTWNFAPGSELSLVWKNSIEKNDDFIIPGYFDNIRQTIDSPQFNSFSIKVLYYLDYHSIKKTRKPERSIG